MSDEQKAAEAKAAADKAAADAGAQAAGTTSANDASIDYDAELLEAAKRFEIAERNRTGYERRVAKKNEAVESGSGDDTDDLDQKIQRGIEEGLKKAMPVLQKTFESDLIQRKLNDLTANPSEQKLILFHFENSVGTLGTIDERLENAQLIANKKTLIKKNKELAIAAQNRSQMSNNAQGSSQEGMKPRTDTVLSNEQIKALKDRGWDDKKIELFKANLRKNNK